jgi:hypothetical protein
LPDLVEMPLVRKRFSMQGSATFANRRKTVTRRAWQAGCTVKACRQACRLEGRRAAGAS